MMENPSVHLTNNSPKQVFLYTFFIARVFKLQERIVMYIRRVTTTLRNRGRLGQGFSFSAGKRSLSSASQTDDDVFFAKTFFLLQSVYGIQIPPYFDDDGGLIDYGECIVLYDLYYSSRSFFFFFFFLSQ